MTNTIWLLIIMSYTAYGSVTSISKFDTQDACLQAKFVIAQTIQGYNSSKYWAKAKLDIPIMYCKPGDATKGNIYERVE